MIPQIVGVDNASITGHNDMRAIVLRHMDGLCEMFRYTEQPVTFIVAVESNLGLVTPLLPVLPLQALIASRLHK